jgi:hypothetical protein
MTTYQVLAVRGHETETIHVERHDTEDIVLMSLGAGARKLHVDGAWCPCEVIGFVEADTADAAHDAACAEFLR